jgi:hypothetical protein
MKILPVGAELFCEDGRTDVTRLIAAFRNFANAPKTVITLVISSLPRLIYYPQFFRYFLMFYLFFTLFSLTSFVVLISPFFFAFFLSYLLSLLYRLLHSLLFIASVTKVVGSPLAYSSPCPPARNKIENVEHVFHEVRFEAVTVLTEYSLLAPCSLVAVQRRFGTYLLDL